MLIRAFLILLLALAVVPCAARPKAEARLFIHRVPTPQERAARYTRALFEPEVGCYLGAFIDFDSTLNTLQNPIKLRDGTPHHLPETFERIVGKPHAMYFFYLGYGKNLPIEWVMELGKRNKFVHIALEPNNGLDKVKDDAYLNKLADDMKRSGAKIFLRFASEMNGTWTAYNKNPAEYRKKYKLVHDVMHRRAPNVATVWCPYTFPRNNIQDYYPGDDATDWVGINAYSVTYHNNNINAPSEFEHPSDLIKPVYDLYAARKPMMICEYASTHYSKVEGRPRPDFALRKIVTLYNALPRIFPRIKCINYFDGNALQYAAERASNDYSVTNDPLVVAAYRWSVEPRYFLTTPEMVGNPSADAVPMPVRKGELLRGKVRLSCWARTPSDILKVIYKIDGIPIYRADRPDLWECIWDASSVRPGKHKLALVVLRSNGSVAATQTVEVKTQR
jgi:hypothetical protein